MTLIRDWNEFWFTEKSPAPLGLYRIVFGMVCIFWGILAAPPFLYTWYSERGVVPLSFYQTYKGDQIEISLLNSVSNEHVLFLFWCLYLLVAFMFMIGFYTRISSVALFVLLLSFNFRDPMVLNSGDTMMRCLLFLLLLAPIDASCSVDRLIAIAKGKDPGGPPAPVELWAQRLIQMQVSLVYIATVCAKLNGDMWMDGSAVYYPLHMEEMQRFPLPAFVYSPNMIVVLTWGTLITEAMLGVCVWNRRLRGYSLTLGVLLHSGIEYALNIPLFSLIMITSYTNFLYNEWLTSWVDALSRSFSRYKLSVQLPAGVRQTDRWWLVVERMDALHLLTAVDDLSADHTCLYVLGKGWEAEGVSALRRILIAFPALWIISPLFFIPGSEKLLEHLMPASSGYEAKPNLPVAAV